MTDRDESPRKQEDDHLRRNEQRYRELFENAHDLVYTHDLQGRITSFNAAAERVVGRG